MSPPARDAVRLTATETLTLGLAVQELHAAFGPGTTYLFGSRVRGEAHPGSDMDILHVPRSRTAPAIGAEAAVDHVERTVARRGGRIDLGIQIVPEHRFEDAAFEEPYLKSAIKEMQEAKGVVMHNLRHLPEARVLQDQLRQDRPLLTPARARGAERD